MAIRVELPPPCPCGDPNCPNTTSEHTIQELTRRLREKEAMVDAQRARIRLLTEQLAKEKETREAVLRRVAFFDWVAEEVLPGASDVPDERDIQDLMYRAWLAGIEWRLGQILDADI